jgi:archaeosine-15-forming tRNA-guanine transglycosylase
MLSSDQKKYRFAVCTELKEQAENNPNFVSTIITGDGSWVQPRDEAAVVSVEDSNLTVTEESTTS